MAQITTGIRSILSLPKIYDVVQDLIGARRFRDALVQDHLRIQSNQRLLDIGCGTARILPHLPTGIGYVGVDLSPHYIEAARSEFGARGEFQCVDVGAAPADAFRNFDAALATGLLHHLDDDEVLSMLHTARGALADHGRLVTVDPCFTDGQSRLAAFIIGKDRGQNVRTPAAYLALARTVFPKASVTIRTDLLRIPYSHAILECPR